MPDVFHTLGTVRQRTQPIALRAALRAPSPLRPLVAGRSVELDGQALDPEMATILRMRRLGKLPPVEALPLPAGRAALVRECQYVGGEQPIGESRDLIIPDADGGERRARLYTPRGVQRPTPLLLYFHGGGWVYGDLDAFDAVCRYLAERAGIRVLCVTYRRAPEYRFPAAPRDCFAAYTWTRESDNAESLGVHPARLAVGGDSAGGNLAAGVCLRAREEGIEQPTLQVLAYPPTDFTQRLPSQAKFGEGFWLTRSFMDRCEMAYVASDTSRSDPLLSPLQARDLSGLAPAYVVTAGFDPWRDEGEAFAQKIAADGGTVELKRHPGLIHGFINMVGVSESARAAVGEIVERLRKL